ncbi:hypothetical protein BYT27DRAFT_7301508 [Phlegmacium glaucopus]|nr:hypothetical protein BYT27DRAFT_7301508 [Phlegmacium glaucopus]
MADVNRGWPVEAHYMPIRWDARNLSIMKQPQPMKRMIHTAVNQVTEHFLFDSAYPAAKQVEFDTFYHDVFIQCLKRLKYFEITKRLKADNELVRLCARVINARVSNLHTCPKGITNKKVEGFYQLLAGDDAGSCVKALTNKDQDYIYPAAICVDTNHPYFHPCIISSMKECFFTGSRGTHGQKYQTQFSSCITDGPGKSELELPIPMVCIVATLAHASLDDWSQGYKRTKRHELFLTTLREEHPEFYHKLMSDLYNAVACVS